MEGAERRSVNSELWHACAGPRVSLPSVGSLVVYFPQGHSEQVAASTSKEVDGRIPNYPNLQSQLVCQLHNIALHADMETDEVFAQMTLQPVNEQEKDLYLPPDIGTPNRQPNDFFCKTLTASDTSTHGGFSVPRRAAEKVFPPLDFTKQPPAQELRARDLHDNVWTFRHIYRGQPKRHLLTTGWSVFVSAKRLVAGDSVLFIRDDKGQLLLGIRRANSRQPNLMPSSVLSSDSMHIGVLAAAAHAAATSSRFQVFYNPRTSPSEFVIPLSKYRKAVHFTQVSVGMRFRMVFETEESTLRRYMGTVTGIGDLDHVRWPGSKWRNLEVGWDESSAGERPRRVSLWEIEPVSTPFVICPPPFALRPKRPAVPGLFVDDTDIESSMKRSLTWQRLDNSNFQNLPGNAFQGLGLPGDSSWIQFQQRQDPVKQEMYDSVGSTGLQGIDASKLLQQHGQLRSRQPSIQQELQQPSPVVWPQTNVHQQVFQNTQQQVIPSLPTLPQSSLTTTPTQTQLLSQSQSQSLPLPQTTSMTVQQTLAQSRLHSPLSHQSVYPAQHQSTQPLQPNSQVQLQPPTTQTQPVVQPQAQQPLQSPQSFSQTQQQATQTSDLPSNLAYVRSQSLSMIKPFTGHVESDLGYMPSNGTASSFTSQNMLGRSSFSSEDSIQLSGLLRSNPNMFQLPHQIQQQQNLLQQQPCFIQQPQPQAHQQLQPQKHLQAQPQLIPPSQASNPDQSQAQIRHLSQPQSQLQQQAQLQQQSQTKPQPQSQQQPQQQSQESLSGLTNLPQMETQLTGSWYSFSRETDPSIVSNTQIGNGDTSSSGVQSSPYSLPPEALENASVLPCASASFQTTRLSNSNKEAPSKGVNDTATGSFLPQNGGCSGGGTSEAGCSGGGPVINGVLDESALARTTSNNWSQAPPPVRTFTKVHKSGSVGRSIDLSRLKSYDELRHELARMFNIEGQLEDPQRSYWKLVFVDNVGDILLVGDDPWEEFVSCVRAIKILSTPQVLQMNQEGLDQISNLPMQQQTSSSSEDCQLWKEA